MSTPRIAYPSLSEFVNTVAKEGGARAFFLLPRNLQWILVQRYDNRKTLEEIAFVFELSTERIRQLLRHAEKCIRLGRPYGLDDQDDWWRGEEDLIPKWAQIVFHTSRCLLSRAETDFLLKCYIGEAEA